MPLASIMPSPKSRTVWNAIEGLIPLENLAARLLGPPAKREGGRLLRRCPFHDDHNPSFEVNPQRRRWKCWSGCGHGDAADLVMRLEGVAFPQAVEHLAEMFSLRREEFQAPASRPPAISRRPRHEAPDLSPDLREEGEKLVAEAERRLWEPRHRKTLMRLVERGLAAETIREARLGLIGSTRVPLKIRPGRFTTAGITIPWFDNNDRLVLLKIRRHGNPTPKYHATYWGRPMIYPSPSVIRPGRPLIVVEGEFDALLVAQELGDRAAVMTLGAASGRRSRDVDASLASGFPIYVATDADAAADRVAGIWPKHAIRVRPDAKDWGELHKTDPEAIIRVWSTILAPPAAETALCPEWLVEALEETREERRAIQEADGIYDGPEPSMSPPEWLARLNKLMGRPNPPEIVELQRR